MLVEQWDTSRLKPYSKNPRKIPEAAIAKVAKSITEFGWQQPIVVDAEGVVIVGHTRLLAAARLNLATVPVQVATDLTPSQAKAYRLMDNRSSQEASWAFETLTGELKDLQLDNYDLTLTGFTPMEIGPMLGAQWTPEPPTGNLGDFDKAGTTPKNEVKFTTDQAKIINNACDSVRASLDKPSLPTADCLVHICSKWDQ